MLICKNKPFNFTNHFMKYNKQKDDENTAKTIKMPYFLMSKLTIFFISYLINFNYKCYFYKTKSQI